MSLYEVRHLKRPLDLASQGDNRKVDKLVKNIYGGDYEKKGNWNEL